MLLEYFFSAIVLGIVVAIPPGSVTVVACQRALQFGFKNSIYFTLGSACSDVFYLILVSIGVAHFVSDNPFLKIGLGIFCGIILVLLGTLSLLEIRKQKAGRAGLKKLSENPLATFISGILVTLTNPMTIVGWLAIAGNFYLIWDEKFPAVRQYAVLTIVLIMVGCLGYFIPLTLVVSRLKKIMSDKVKIGLIIVSDICLMVFGVAALYYAVQSILRISNWV